MKRIFVDTNVIVDLIADRKPFSKYAVEIFRKAEQNEIELFCSSHSIATTHYLLKKYIDEKSLRSILLDLLDYLSVIAIDLEVLKKGLRSKHKDFEDAIQIICASEISKIDCILTRNLKDFRGSSIKVLPPEELSQLI